MFIPGLTYRSPEETLALLSVSSAQSIFCAISTEKRPIEQTVPFLFASFKGTDLILNDNSLPEPIKHI